jgi:anti-anti-sigma factor
MIQITYDDERRTLHCQFMARMDSVASAAATEKLEERLNEALQSAQKGKETDLNVIFDLEKVDYVASAFLRLCITVAKRLDKECFTVVKCNPSVKKIFTIGGLDKIMEIH